ncbi:MAG: HlyD family efflux transporter periplasmic adaptor subunit [bacterium]|nr:HlyD family efflux transporter periplasmic adaptor subunit [bacterium]
MKNKLTKKIKQVITGSEEENEQAVVDLTLPPVDSPSENFLVIEYLRQMPAVVSRGVLYLIMLTIAVGIAYSLLSEIDVVVEARSVARPASHKIKVYSDSTGHIEKVYIREGQEVSEKDPLFLIRSKEALMYSSNVQVSKLQLEKNTIELKSIQSDLGYWKKQAANLMQEFKDTKVLYQKRLTSITEYNDIKSRLEYARTEIKKLYSQQKIKKNENLIIRQEMKKNKKMLSSGRNASGESVDEKKKNTDDAGENKDEEKKLYAGIRGIISELHFRNPGEYVRESTLLCTIIPSDSPLYMDTIVMNRDIGFIEEKMEIKLKFDAFPYVDYGTLRGTVSSISPSAVEDKNLGFVYHINGKLSKTFFEIKGKKYYIKPGMTATAELITEKKSIFSILFNKFKFDK